MPPRRKLTILDQGQAQGWLQDGVSGREVLRRLVVSNSVIQRHHQPFQTIGSADQRPQSGRPRCTDRRDDRYLKLMALRNRTIPLGTLIGNLRATANVTVSCMTVTRRLREVRLQSSRTIVRVPVKPRHRRAKMVLCRNHRRLNRLRLGRVLFTDESLFSMSSCDARKKRFETSR